MSFDACPAPVHSHSFLCFISPVLVFQIKLIFKLFYFFRVYKTVLSWQVSIFFEARLGQVTNDQVHNCSCYPGFVCTIKFPAKRDGRVNEKHSINAFSKRHQGFCLWHRLSVCHFNGGILFYKFEVNISTLTCIVYVALFRTQSCSVVHSGRTWIRLTSIVMRTYGLHYVR